MALDSSALIQRIAESRNPRQAQAKQAADLGLQQAAANIPVGSPTSGGASSPLTSIAQSIGGQMAQLSAQKNMAGVQSQAGILQGAGQLGIAQQGQQVKELGTSLQSGVQSNQMAQEQMLSDVSLKAKTEIYDARRKFAQDQAGLKFANDKQLSDFARLQATSQQDYQNYQTNLQVAYDRKGQMLDIASKKIASELQFQNDQMNQLQDQVQRQTLTGAQQTNARNILAGKIEQINQLSQARVNLENQIKEQQAAAADAQMRAQAIGTIAGAAAGGIATESPQGAQAGASLGSGLGGMAAANS